MDLSAVMCETRRGATSTRVHVRDDLGKGLAMTCKYIIVQRHLYSNQISSITSGAYSGLSRLTTL
jgi:hypothetical protein